MAIPGTIDVAKVKAQKYYVVVVNGKIVTKDTLGRAYIAALKISAEMFVDGTAIICPTVFGQTPQGREWDNRRKEVA